MTDHLHPVDPERVAAAQAGQLSAAEAQRLSALLGVPGDPGRARILTALLAGDELCVGDFALSLDVSEDSVTYALRVLRVAGLVRRRREGRLGYYRLTDEDWRPPLVTALEQLQELARRQPQPDAEQQPEMT